MAEKLLFAVPILVIAGACALAAIRGVRTGALWDLQLRPDRLAPELRALV